MQSMQNQHIMLGAAEVHVYVQNWQLHTVSAYIFLVEPLLQTKREKTWRFAMIAKQQVKAIICEWHNGEREKVCINGKTLCKNIAKYVIAKPYNCQAL